MVTDRHRQTDRQTDTHTDTQTHRHGICAERKQAERHAAAHHWMHLGKHDQLKTVQTGMQADRHAAAHHWMHPREHAGRSGVAEGL